MKPPLSQTDTPRNDLLHPTQGVRSDGIIDQKNNKIQLQKVTILHIVSGGLQKDLTYKTAEQKPILSSVAHYTGCHLPFLIRRNISFGSTV